MWSLNKMHQVGELIAAFAVVISLIFVGLQIKGNTIATEAATYQDTVAYDIEILLNMASTPEMARVFFTFRDDPESLSEDEFLQGQTLLNATVRHLENLYLQHEAGMLSDAAWATREPLIRTYVLSPGFERLMSGSTGQNYGGSFIDYTERIRNESKGGAGN
jgi:hypothetical protein